MILVLTYHKVLPEPGPKPGFYTITAEDLRRQLDLLAGSGLEPLAPGQLNQGGLPPKPAYLLTFDDATVDHYEVVRPVLERQGLRGVFFAPTARLDRPGYLSSRQALELSQSGHLLGLHSHEHRRLDRMGEEDIRAQMERSRDILTELVGQAPVAFAPVGGYYNPCVQRVAWETGVRVMRTMRWGDNRRLDPKVLDSIPINRFLSEREFLRLVTFRSPSGLYYAKQLTKKFMPGAFYEEVRGLVFQLRGRK